MKQDLNPTISVNLNVNGEFESAHLNANGWNKVALQMLPNDNPNMNVNVTVTRFRFRIRNQGDDV